MLRTMDTSHSRAEYVFKIRYPLKGNFFKAKNLKIVFLIWIVSGFLALTVALMFGLNKNNKINNIFLLCVQIIIVLPGPISLFLFFWIAVTSCKINLDVPPMPGGATVASWKEQLKKIQEKFTKNCSNEFHYKSRRPIKCNICYFSILFWLP